eukprot:gnl/TRDRNA2_/TRDRNA2_137433_c1_seq1.p1 gnl/TRDRNA2_/TRDRNA2_137433_c1~~gnl/TRDRNA2_/TRDRNA2_137433_c1_seq1.p1  ORF type:complete len:239 (-),score=39.93 gnl/TRDRNA2_/TRDRNA2_137433_c1_seq1:9-650(-)
MGSADDRARFAFTPIASGPCRRQGHSAVLAGNSLYVLGGTDHVGGGLPWYGEEMEDVTVLDIPELRWQKSQKVRGERRAVARQHSAALVLDTTLGFATGGDDVALIFGGGLGGHDGASLLPLRINGTQVQPFATRCPEVQLEWCRNSSSSRQSGVSQKLRSASPPPLRGQASVWTGRELVLYGGAAAEMPGYFGMMLLRPLHEEPVLPSESEQ